MKNSPFVFTMLTKEKIKASVLLSDQGDVLGRIFKKTPEFKDSFEEFNFKDSYSYEIESTEETFKKIESGEIKLMVKEYHVFKSNTVLICPSI